MKIGLRRQSPPGSLYRIISWVLILLRVPVVMNYFPLSHPRTDNGGVEFRVLVKFDVPLKQTQDAESGNFDAKLSDRNPVIKENEK